MNVFSKKIKAALQKIPPFKKVVVGLSGGMDSVVLTHVLKQLGYEVIVAHLNHDLRSKASDEDAAFVADLAKTWTLPCSIKKTALPKKGNLENQARIIRYAYLEDVREAHQADFIAVGHHFDDQIETVLMHKKRGAGLRGERGMQLISGRIIRPMLDIPRREIKAYAQSEKLNFRTDASNFDLDFERNRLRQKVIPKLKEKPEFEDEMRKKIEEASDKLQTLQTKREKWLETNFKTGRFDRHRFNALEWDLKIEILIHLLGQQNLYSKTLDRLVHFFQTGKTGKKLQVKNAHFRIEYDQICFIENEPPNLNPTQIDSKNSDPVIWGDYSIQIKNLKGLKVRTWKDGDRFQPTGMQGSKKLQDFFVDQKIPRHQRKRIPIIVNENDEIICVENLRFSEIFKGLKEKILISKRSKP